MDASLALAVACGLLFSELARPHPPGMQLNLCCPPQCLILEFLLASETRASSQPRPTARTGELWQSTHALLCSHPREPAICLQGPVMLMQVLRVTLVGGTGKRCSARLSPPPDLTSHGRECPSETVSNFTSSWRGRSGVGARTPHKPL